jgi:hypothetical protein
MPKVKLTSVYNEKTPKKLVDLPIARMFNKIKNYKSPLLNHELLRKRKKVK